MMPRKSYDWIIVHDGTHGDLAYALKCTRCGCVQKVAIPISVTCWCAMARAFGKEHRRCKEATDAKP
jgi:hypothetical protein